MGGPIAMDRAPAAPRLGYLRLALDRASVRSKDEFGRLHVAMANISKANVCPYYGREIPGGEALGLEPDKAYKLLRDPEELAKSVPTWNNLPLLDLHLPTSAKDPQKDNVIGATGTDATFEAPYLKNSLAVWDGDAIALVESDDQRELSCGYRYRADMTPGVHEGEPYDGIMRDIVGNHVAIVSEGRAGPDIIIGDSNIKKGNPVIKTTALRSRQALMVQGALAAYLAPRLAADAKIDLTLALDGVTRSNFKRQRAGILTRLTKLVEGKLAADADLGEVAELLETLEACQSEGEDELKDDDDKKAEDEESDEEKAAKEKAAQDAKDAEEKEAAEAEKAAKDAEADKDEKVSKPAMDAAIAKARSDARRDVMRELGAIDAAKAAVRPHIGEITGRVESATEIYRMALDAAIDAGADIELDGLPTSAYPALVRLLPVPGAEPRRREPLAADGAASKSFADRYPGAARIRSI